MRTNETSFNNQEFDMQEARESVAKAVQEQERELEETKRVEKDLEKEELEAEFRASEQERIEREAQDHKERIEGMTE